jgi:hypothetical protein
MKPIPTNRLVMFWSRTLPSGRNELASISSVPENACNFETVHRMLKLAVKLKQEIVEELLVGEYKILATWLKSQKQLTDCDVTFYMLRFFENGQPYMTNFTTADRKEVAYDVSRSPKTFPYTHTMQLERLNL